jgi:hypothetical protein
VGEPVLLVRQGLIYAVVEVLVVGEDNMPTDVIQLETPAWSAEELSCASPRQMDHNEEGGSHTKPSGVMSVEASPPAFSSDSSSSHDGPFWEIG